MSEIAQSPKDPAFVQNPYRFYDRARKMGDVVFWSDYDMPVAFSHRATSLVLRDKRFGRTAPDAVPAVASHLEDFAAIEAYSLLEMDGPPHVRLRKLLRNAFSNKEIMAISPIVSLICDDLISKFPEGPFDLIEAFASPLPIKVICHLMGVPASMSEELLGWSHAMVAMYQAGRTHDVELAANDAARAFRGFLADFIQSKREHPGDDLTSTLLAAENNELATDELVSVLALLLNAGHEATVHTIGNGMYNLMHLNQPYETMLPLHVTDTIEEILRFDPPLHMFKRYAYEDVDVFGHKVERGQQIGALLASANRDPAIWSMPNQFDPTRPDAGQVSFGAGPHFCLGAPLARLELQVVLPALFSPSLGLRLVEPPTYSDIYHFHGLERLMVERTVWSGPER